MLFATMALLPPLLQNLMGYPVITTGTGARAARRRHHGRDVRRRPPDRQGRHARARSLFGPRADGLSLWEMTQFTPNVSASTTIVYTGVIQGLGLGLIFVPLSTLAFATLAPRFRDRGHRDVQPDAQHRQQRSASRSS